MSDAALLEPGWRERTCRVNGIELHLVEAGDPGDPVLVLLHGFPDFWWSWRRQITPLAAAGFRVVAPDLRGYNLSERPQGHAAYGLDVLAADVIALADALGVERLRLVGHDWGAIIGWWTAERHPERIDRAVLINGPHPDAWAGTLLRHPGQILRSAYIPFFRLPGLPEAALAAGDFAWLRSALRRSARAGTFAPGDLDRHAAAWSRPGALAAMLSYYRALRRGPHRPSIRIDPAVLTIRGDSDRFLGRHVMEASARLCANGRFTTIAGAGHWVHLEDPGRINAEITEFMIDR